MFKIETLPESVKKDEDQIWRARLSARLVLGWGSTDDGHACMLVGGGDEEEMLTRRIRRGLVS